MNKLRGDILLQNKFLNTIRGHEASKKKLADLLITMLQVSESSAYRRLGNESMFSFEEICVLARHFGISLDQMVDENNDTFLFQFPSLLNPVKSFKDYFAPIARDVKQLTTLPNSSCDFISREIPVFHYFRYPELTAFKAYLWGKMMWEFPTFKNKNKFSLKQITGIHRFRKTIIEHYNQVPGIEVWGDNPLKVTLKQIEYHVVTDMFKNPDEALLLCDQLKDLMQHLQRMAFYRKKISSGIRPKVNAPNFTLYHSQMSSPNNSLLVQSDVFNMAHFTIDNLHTLRSSDPRIVNFMRETKRKVIRQSDEVTLTSEKSRVKFFNDAYRKLAAFKKQLKQYIEENKK